MGSQILQHAVRGPAASASREGGRRRLARGGVPRTNICLVGKGGLGPPLVPGRAAAGNMSRLMPPWTSSASPQTTSASVGFQQARAARHLVCAGWPDPAARGRNPRASTASAGQLDAAGRHASDLTGLGHRNGASAAAARAATDGRRLLDRALGSGEGGRASLSGHEGGGPLNRFRGGSAEEEEKTRREGRGRERRRAEVDRHIRRGQAAQVVDVGGQGISGSRTGVRGTHALRMGVWRRYGGRQGKGAGQ